MVTKVEQHTSAEERDAAIKRQIGDLLDALKAGGPDAIVVFACVGDKVLFRYVGKPAELFHLANMGHEHVMAAFKLDAAQPLPGEKVN